MKKIRNSALLVPLVVAVSVVGKAGGAEVDFNREIRPILSANCFACHGPDEEAREAGLRLDLAEGAREVVSGGAKSELVERLRSDDPDEVMPPPDSGHQLTRAEIDLLQRWVTEGAGYARHWAFEKPVKVAVPPDRHPIDFFVERKLGEVGLEMSPPAERLALLRRLSLDLTGLPPSLEMAEEFLAKGNDQEMIDRLLASPAFGEHWARLWLDLVRYADTKGYEKDRGRTIWRYRDWVIQALNEDMPFEKFTRDQLAGDLLPDPTPDQILATAFHRNTMENDEGGTDNEEFRVAAVKDRVDTTMQVWMGLTMGCAKCHTHKYDPISIEDYYSFYALFNQTEDADQTAPVVPTPTTEQRKMIARLEAEIAGLSAQLASDPEGFAPAFSEWRQLFAEKPLWSPLALVEQKTKGSKLVPQADGKIAVEGEVPDQDTWTLTLDLPKGEGSTALRLEVFPGKNVALREIGAEWLEDDKEPVKIPLRNPRADFSQRGWEVHKAIDGSPRRGWAVGPKEKEPHVAIFDFEKPLAGGKLRLTLEQEHGEGLILRSFRLSVSPHPVSWLAAEVKAEAGLERIFREKLFETTRKWSERLQQAREELASVRRSVPTTPIMRELPPEKQRITRIHRRGNFLDQGEEVTPRLPQVFGDFPDGAPANRLGVARWLTHPDNPLTGRVMVNRVWARLFGRGIVETEEDFGMQGAVPTHPELLDWMAVDYQENGWSLKKLLRFIVNSRAYRQTSRISSDRLNRDPRNQWLSRGPRFRLTAEMVRDQALAASGLLTRKVGGPSVMPPQPPGVWKSTYNGDQWQNATGPDRYRRGVYTYLKRTSPYPSLTTFDAGSGEVCQIRRVRTNTPLQALVGLNDPVFLEAAGALSQRMEDLAHGFRLVLIRPPKPAELARLEELHETMQEHYRQNPEAAAGLVASAGLEEGDAALIAVANVILNLDETLMKP